MTDTTKTRDWQPGGLELVIWNVIALALFVFFLGIYANISSEGGTVEVGLSDLVTAVITVNALMILHEFIHGVLMRRFGGTPKYGLKMLGRVVPVAYATSPGTRFTRGAFLLISLAPFLLISIGGAILVGALPGKSALPIALAVHAAGCIGDLWVVGLALRQPAGTLYEDKISGLSFHYPANETGAA